MYQRFMQGDSAHDATKLGGVERYRRKNVGTTDHFSWLEDKGSRKKTPKARV